MCVPLYGRVHVQCTNASYMNKCISVLFTVFVLLLHAISKAFSHISHGALSGGRGTKNPIYLLGLVFFRLETNFTFISCYRAKNAVCPLVQRAQQQNNTHAHTPSTPMKYERCEEIVENCKCK